MEKTILRLLPQQQKTKKTKKTKKKKHFQPTNKLLLQLSMMLVLPITIFNLSKTTTSRWTTTKMSIKKKKKNSPLLIKFI